MEENISCIFFLHLFLFLHSLPFHESFSLTLKTQHLAGAWLFLTIDFLDGILDPLLLAP